MVDERRIEQRKVEQRREPRAVQVTLALDWAQAVTRLQQMHNAGCSSFQLVEDETGRVRVEVED